MLLALSVNSLSDQQSAAARVSADAFKQCLRPLGKFRRCHDEGIGARRKAQRSETILDPDWQLANALADGVVEGVGDRGLDAGGAQGDLILSMGCFSGCCGIVLADYPRGGSSRSIPLAAVVIKNSLAVIFRPDAILASFNFCLSLSIPL